MEVDKSGDQKEHVGSQIGGKPFKIEARDIILKPFVVERQTFLANLQHQDFLDAWQSTPHFIKKLTDISDEVMKYQTPKEKKLFLKQALCEVNKKLPA